MHRNKLHTAIASARPPPAEVPAGLASKSTVKSQCHGSPHCKPVTEPDERHSRRMLIDSLGLVKCQFVKSLGLYASAEQLQDPGHSSGKALDELAVVSSEWPNPAAMG